MGPLIAVLSSGLVPSLRFRFDTVNSSPATAAVFLTLALTCDPASPAEPRGGSDPVLAPVQVTAQRDPVEKSYRKIVRGMDLFEQRRASMAPKAALRFKLLPRNRETSMQGVALSIAGETVDIPVPLAPDY